MNVHSRRSRHQSYVTAFRLAVDSIRAHKLRSFLTLLGVIIGVASVVVVGAAIEGLGIYAETSTSKVFGAEGYLVAQMASVGRLSQRQLLAKLRYSKVIRQADLEFLRETTGDVAIYSAFRQFPQDIRRGDELVEGVVVAGVSATLPEIRDVVVADGRFFTESEERNRQFVIVIGEGVRQRLFPETSAVGRTVKMSGADLTVVGVVEKLGSAFGRDQDTTAYIPETTYGKLYGSRQSIAIFGRARPESGLSLDQAVDYTRVALRTRFHTLHNQPDRFDTLKPESIRSFVDGILGLISKVVVPVTLLSLVIGGIVIMNIMLVSVTERTHEIGIRKSLGARQSDIRLQFLSEAVIMAAAGGAIGVGAGALASELLSHTLGVHLPITAPYVLLALFVSSFVGILSGWYPAARAAKLDPVAALRAE